MAKDKTKEAIHGYIYRATNLVNNKNYMGQTVVGRWKEGQNPIKERWKEEVGDAYTKKARGENLRYIENAIIKYGPENFELKEEDVAYSQSELDAKETRGIKDYDTMNPDKGYNMKEGGRGGRLSEQTKEKLSNAINAKYQNDPEYREKQTKERRERAKDPEWRKRMSEAGKKKYREDPKYREKQNKERRERAKDPEFLKKMTDINRTRAKDPEWRKKLSEIRSKKWQEKEYREKTSEILKERAKDPEWLKKMSEILKERAKDPEWLKKMTDINRARAQDPEWRKKMREINKQYRKEIPDKREFLKEIKDNMPKKEMLKKYDMGGKTFNRRVQEMFGPDGPKNYTELKNYMRDRNVDGVLKEIEERNKEKDVKPESQGKDSKDKGESKSPDDLKEKTDKDTKSDEKEDLEEPSKEENEDNKSDKNKENSERNQNHENSDENLREKGEKSAEIEENIESKNKETMNEDTSEEKKENNVKDSEENKSKDSSNSEVEAKCGKNFDDMENLNLTVKDYAGIDKNSSESEQDITCLDGEQDGKNSSKREQDITCLDENQDSKNSGSIKYIDLGNEDIKSIETVKDIKTDDEKDYTGVDEGGKKERPDYAFIDNYLDKTKRSEVSEDDKRTERGKEYRHT